MKTIKYSVFLFVLLANYACNFERGTIIVQLKGNLNSQSNLRSLAKVELINNQFVLTGTNLSNITGAKILEGSTETPLVIESVNATTIVANTLANVSFAAGKVFNFILSDASGASTYTVNFSLCDSTLNGKEFNCNITAQDKDVLSFDATTNKWIPRNVNGLAYQGTFDASGGVDPGGAPAAGDYYIIATPGTINSIAYLAGDWISYSGDEWQKIANAAAGVGVWTVGSGNAYRTTGNVGIGTATPTSLIEAQGNNPFFKLKNTADTGGVFMLQTWSSGQLGMYNPSGSSWGAIPANSFMTNLAFDLNGVVGSATNSTLGFPTYRNILDNGNGGASFTGNVGIGTTSPGYKLQVGIAADGSQARANAWNTLSDERLKRDFELIPASLEKILSLNGYYYYWNRGTDTSKKMGVKAQEVEKVFPEVVSHGKDGFLSVSYNHLVAGVIQAVKEFYYKWLGDSEAIHKELALKADKLEVEKKLAMKEKEIAALKKENALIKAYLCSKDHNAAFCK